MCFTDLLQIPAFQADLADYENLSSQNHPAAGDVWEWIRDHWGYEI